MTTSKTPIRCKFVVDDKIVHQEGKVKYLGIDKSGYWDVETEIRDQAARAMRTAFERCNLVEQTHTDRNQSYNLQVCH